MRLRLERGLASLFKRPALSSSSGLIPTWPTRCSSLRAVVVCVLLSRSALAIGESRPIAPEEPPRAETSTGDIGEVPDEVPDETSPIQAEPPAPLTEPSSDSAEDPGAPSGRSQVPSTTRNSARNFEAARGNMDSAPGVEEQKELPPPRKPPFHFLSLDTFYFWFGLHGGYAWLHSAEAARTHIGQSGATFYGTIGIGLFDLVTLGGSAGWIYLKDHAAFEEEVEVILGDTSQTSATSSVKALNTSVEVGLRSPNFCLDEAVADTCFAIHAFTNFGHAWTSAVRSIDDCGDCTSQDLDLADGGFLEPGLAIGLPSRNAGIDLRGSFRQYFGEAAMANELRIGFALMLF